MSDGATITSTVLIRLTVGQIAAAFASLDDEEQTKFFCEVAKIMSAWGPGKLETQCFNLGRHLRTCPCTSWGAQQVMEAMANGYEFDNIKAAKK